MYIRCRKNQCKEKYHLFGEFMEDRDILMLGELLGYCKRLKYEEEINMDIEKGIRLKRNKKLYKRRVGRKKTKTDEM